LWIVCVPCSAAYSPVRSTLCSWYWCRSVVVTINCVHVSEQNADGSPASSSPTAADSDRTFRVIRRWRRRQRTGIYLSGKKRRRWRFDGKHETSLNSSVVPSRYGTVERIHIEQTANSGGRGFVTLRRWNGKAPRPISQPNDYQRKIPSRYQRSLSVYQSRTTMCVVVE